MRVNVSAPLTLTLNLSPQGRGIFTLTLSVRGTSRGWIRSTLDGFFRLFHTRIRLTIFAVIAFD